VIATLIDPRIVPLESERLRDFCSAEARGLFRGLDYYTSRSGFIVIRVERLGRMVDRLEGDCYQELREYLRREWQASLEDLERREHRD
jgi:hypothetical protein